MKLTKIESTVRNGRLLSVGLFPTSDTWSLRLVAVEWAHGEGWREVALYLPQLVTAGVVFSLGRFALAAWRGEETFGVEVLGLGGGLMLCRGTRGSGVSGNPAPADVVELPVAPREAGKAAPAYREKAA
ncbi:MAG: hypothetical protein GXP48_09285 [Acidobacteria bacterium]|nr:hypothetical protein [Acidobacteriota bacterium]